MNIGIDASRANLAQKTGTELYAYTLIEQFKKIANPADHFWLYSKEALAHGLEHLPANFVSRVLGWPPKFLWTQLRLSLAMIFRPPDVLFVPAHTLPLWHPAKTVVTIHDIGFERIDRLYDVKQIGHGSWSRRILSAGARLFTFGKYGASELDYHRWATEFAIRHARKIITVSQFSKQEIMNQYRVEDGKIEVVYHGIDQSIFKVVDDQAAITNTLSDLQITKPFLLYVGRLEAKKNIPGLIEIFHLLKTKYQLPHQLLLVGKPGLHYDQVERLIAHHGLGESVIRPGFVDEAKLIHLRNAADVFVFPSMYEGFGLPILESMACGTPVVCSRAASLPEIAGDAAILANPENYEEFAAAIHRVITTPALRADLIQRGHQRVLQFQWDACAQQTLRLIRSL